MIKTVIKRNGTKQPFDIKKLNMWAEYAAKSGGDWSTIAMQTVRRLPTEAKSEDIMQMMIDMCISQESLEFSRLAARLEFARIRKHMDANLISDKEDFTDIMAKFIKLGVWDENSLPEINREWNQWYYDLYDIKLEFWQVKQFVDKYGIKYDGECIETPHVAALGVALAHFGDHERAFRMAKAILLGKINLATPAINGGRNGDFDAVSCCVITGGDSVDSIGAAEWIADKMTSKKAGIGFEVQTRSLGADVKGGRVQHLGKHPIYSVVDKKVKQYTQVTRGGSATVTYPVIDPELMELLMWKSQKVDIETRIDKLDYSMAYNDAFLEAVINDNEWYLFDLQDCPHMHELFYCPDVSYDAWKDAADFYIENDIKHTVVKARDILKRFLTVRQETGRIYCINVSRANSHTPFNDRITLSNLCQEIFLPTKAYVDMQDLYVGQIEDRFDGTYNVSFKSEGETAFCSLAAINAGTVAPYEYREIADLALRFVDSMIEKAPAMTKTMEESIRRRRSVGIGITGLAQFLYNCGSDYDGTENSLELVSRLSENHYYWLLQASQEMAQESGGVEGIDLNWLPIDTRLNDKYELIYDWEKLRGKPRRHSVLVAHMPTESSSVFSGATNGLYPPRERITYKQSRKGAVQFIVDKEDFIYAWDVGNIVMSKYYSRVQDFTDQGISADYFVAPERYPNGKVPLSILMKEWIAQARLGIKSMYYTNTKPNETKQVSDYLTNLVEAEEEGCDDCKM